MLWLIFLGLALVQVPIAVFQWATLGASDPVQGTLYAKGAGAHLLGGVLTLCVLMLMSRPREVPRWTLATLPLMIGVALFADAKSPLLAGALGAVVWSASPLGSRIRLRRWRTATALLGVALVGTTLFVYHAGQTARLFLFEAARGRWGKAVVASYLWNRMSAEPASLTFGLGPATTVSRASFMTTDLLLKPESPVRLLGLRPSSIALEAAGTVKARLGWIVPTSFNSAQSSALGLLGDLGLVGVAVYGWLVLRVIRALRRSPERTAGAALAGWMMFVILGIIFDWWEEPPFTGYLAMLTGLTLLGRKPAGGSSTDITRPHDVAL